VLEDPDEVGEEVIEGNRPGAVADPAGGDHDRQVVDEVADDFEAGGAGTDDQPGAKFGDRDGPRAEGFASGEAGGEVLGDGTLRPGSAEVDDPLDAGRGCGIAEVAGGFVVEAGEAASGAHGVDEVAGGLDAGEGGGEGLGAEGIGGDGFDAGPGARLEHLEAAGRGADAVAAFGEERDEVAADVAGGAEDEDVHGFAGAAGSRSRAARSSARWAMTRSGMAGASSVSSRRSRWIQVAWRPARRAPPISA